MIYITNLVKPVCQLEDYQREVAATNFPSLKDLTRKEEVKLTETGTSSLASSQVTQARHTRRSSTLTTHGCEVRPRLPVKLSSPIVKKRGRKPKAATQVIAPINLISLDEERRTDSVVDLITLEVMRRTALHEVQLRKELKKAEEGNT